MNLLQFLENRRPLRNIKRFQMEYTIHKQNICEHGYFVGNLFYLLCKEIGIEPTPEEIIKALNHDFVESFTGDLNQAIKGKSSIIEKAWEVIEDEATPKYAKEFTDQSLEILGEPKISLLKLADALDAYLYTKEEIALGNTHLTRAHTYYKKKVRSLLEKFDKLFYMVEKIL